jgi:hypothetical protein
LTMGLMLAALGFSGLNALGGQASADKVRRLMDDMKSDNEQLSQVATIELVGLGESGLAVMDKIICSLGDQGDNEKDWAVYKEIVEKVRKFTPITIHQEKGKALDVMKEISRQAGIGINTASNNIEKQLSNQEINLNVEGTPFWELMDSFMRQANGQGGPAMIAQSGRAMLMSPELLDDRVVFQDAAGKPVSITGRASGSSSMNMNGVTVVTQFTKNYYPMGNEPDAAKLIIKIPSEIKAVVVPFEFHDLDLP